MPIGVIKGHLEKEKDNKDEKKDKRLSPQSTPMTARLSTPTRSGSCDSIEYILEEQNYAWFWWLSPTIVESDLDVAFCQKCVREGKPTILSGNCRQTFWKIHWHCHWFEGELDILKPTWYPNSNSSLVNIVISSSKLKKEPWAWQNLQNILFCSPQHRLGLNFLVGLKSIWHQVCSSLDHLQRLWHLQSGTKIKYPPF